MILNYKAAAFACSLLLISFTAQAANAVHKKEYTKTIKKEYGVGAEGAVHLSNKYGRVDVKTWSGNKVSIEVNIVVHASSESKANDFFDRVTLNFSHGSGVVRAETEIDPMSNSWWNWFNSTPLDYKINYTVYMPAAHDLELRHKYGNAAVAELKGKVLIDLKYGNFRAEGTPQRMSVILKYGNGDITRAGYLNADIGYGSLNLSEVNDMDLLSKYSKVNISKARELRITSKYDSFKLGTIARLKNSGAYDNFNIQSVGTADITTKYTSVVIEQLDDELRGDAAYGQLKIRRISRDFNLINITAKYTDVKLYLASGTTARLDLSVSYADIKVPDALDIRYDSRQNQSRELRGTLGGDAAKGSIKVSLSYGGLSVQQE
jgi:hypothetical protein